MRIPWLRRDRRDEAVDQPPSQVVCPVCGLRNDGTARFCRNCGLPLGAPRDPVRGTISRRADLPSDHGSGIAAVVGLAAAILVLGGAGWLILRSSGGGGEATAVATPTPGPTSAGVAAATARATSGTLPSRAPASSDGAGALPSRRPGPDASAPGETRASAAPTPLVADTDFTCEPAGFDDPSRGTWRVAEARWGARDRWDELTIVLERQEGKGRTRLDVEAMSARDAARVTGLDKAPTERVVLITFDGDVSIGDAIVAQLGLRALEYLNVETTEEATYAVVGVDTGGCFRMFSPVWRRGDTVATGETVRLLLDVRYR